MRFLKVVSTVAMLLMSMDVASAYYYGADHQPVKKIDDGENVLAPLAFIRFCNRYKTECPEDTSTRIVRLDQKSWHWMRFTNILVNWTIRPREDKGRDEWNLGRTAGDCDDYAVEKRHRLMQAGFPSSALSLTEVVARGVGHLILTVRTDQGDFVLDNLTGAIVPWDATGYQFVKMQSAKNPIYWVAVHEAPSAIQMAAAD